MTARRLPFTLVLLAACGGDPVAPSAPLPLPGELHIVGVAAGPRPDRGSIECGFDIRLSLVEIRRTPEFTEYTGTMGGEVYRATTDSTGAGFEVSALVASETAIARLVGRDGIQLLLGDTATGGRRFWRELAVITGTRHQGDPGSGTWTCAPLDLNAGYVDTTGVVQGSWHVEPS
jgi:hypothetical protein